MRIAAALERPLAEDQRRFARYPVRIGAGLGPPERPSTPITVLDLSTNGCGIETAAFLQPGSRVWLKLPGLESWDARVVWSQNGRAGLAFARPLHQGVVDRYR